MHILRSLAVLGLLATLGANGSEGKLSNQVHAVHGTVEHVHHGKGQTAHGEMTVRTHHRATAAKPAHNTEHHFHVQPSTQFVLVHGKQHKATTFAAVHHGEHVVVHRHADHPLMASRVEIHVHKQ